MSRGWIIAAVLFFLFSCVCGGAVVTGLMDSERMSGLEWRESFAFDAGQASSAPDASTPPQ